MEWIGWKKECIREGGRKTRDISGRYCEMVKFVVYCTTVTQS